jgi:hypothetical protein
MTPPPTPSQLANRLEDALAIVAEVRDNTRDAFVEQRLGDVHDEMVDVRDELRHSGAGR